MQVRCPFAGCRNIAVRFCWWPVRQQLEPSSLELRRWSKNKQFYTNVIRMCLINSKFPIFKLRSQNYQAQVPHTHTHKPFPNIHTQTVHSKKNLISRKSSSQQSAHKHALIWKKKYREIIELQEWVQFQMCFFFQWSNLFLLVLFLFYDSECICLA